MQKIIQNEKYGQIVYQEGFWTGKKTISVNGTQLTKYGKKTYLLKEGENKTYVEVKGSLLSGVRLRMGSDEIVIEEKAKWYELALSVLIIVFDLVWGNVPQLCAILPIVGGAIGGFVSAIFAMCNLLVMRKMKNVLLKLLVFVAFFALSVLACYLIALAILSAAA